MGTCGSYPLGYRSSFHIDYRTMYTAGAQTPHPIPTVLLGSYNSLKKQSPELVLEHVTKGPVPKAGGHTFFNLWVIVFTTPGTLRRV